MIIMITAILLSLKVVINPLHAVALSGFPTDLTSGGSGGRCHTEHWGKIQLAVACMYHCIMYQKHVSLYQLNLKNVHLKHALSL